MIPEQESNIFDSTIKLLFSRFKTFGRDTKNRNIDLWVGDCFLSKNYSLYDWWEIFFSSISYH